MTEKFEEVKKELANKIDENPDIFKDLRDYISELESELSEFKIKEAFVDKQIDHLKDENKNLKEQVSESKKIYETFEDDIENLEKELYNATGMIQKLKSENIDLIAELGKEREQTAAYKEDSEKMLEANKELRELLKEKDRKLTVFKNALKECLL